LLDHALDSGDLAVDTFDPAEKLMTDLIFHFYTYTLYMYMSNWLAIAPHYTDRVGIKTDLYPAPYSNHSYGRLSGNESLNNGRAKTSALLGRRSFRFDIPAPGLSHLLVSPIVNASGRHVPSIVVSKDRSKTLHVGSNPAHGHTKRKAKSPNAPWVSP
jgi:hypothetical protein